METIALDKKYHMVYRVKNGQCKSYRVAPFEDTPDSFVAYAYRHGVRKFRKNRVIKFKALN